MIWHVADPNEIARRIANAVEGQNATAPNRRLVAIAGPPGAGKTTVSKLVREELEQRGIGTGVVPMDGFHFDNSILVERGLLDRKGAPETFDAPGFRALLKRLLSEDEVAIPEFDRGQDQAIMARAMINSDQRTIIVEGNYLFLDEAPWTDLKELWTTGVFLDVPMAELERRLIDRWRLHGLGEAAAKKRALSNDIPNAKRVLANSSGFDIRIEYAGERMGNGSI